MFKYFFIVLFLVTNSYHLQAQKLKEIAVKEIKCFGNTPKTKEPAYFVNGYFFPQIPNILERLEKKHIKDIHIEKRDTVIKGFMFRGQIFITYKKKIEKPDFIRLTELRKKYKKIKSKELTIYTIDGKLVKNAIVKFIDTNCVLDIEVDEEVTSIARIGIQVVNIITRTGENINKKNEIKIR